MYLYENRMLIARSSSLILFLRREKDDDSNELIWVQYHLLDARGFIYTIRGNIRLQIITDDHIYFYLLNAEDGIPVIENVMNNYMMCQHLMFGPKVRYCIAYKSGEEGFDIWERKYLHTFQVMVQEEDFTDCVGVPVKHQKAFFLS